MDQQRHRWDIKVKERRSHQINREMAKIENAYYDGEVVYSEYNKAISDFLKDAVSLGIVGGNGTK